MAEESNAPSVRAAYIQETQMNQTRKDHEKISSLPASGSPETRFSDFHLSESRIEPNSSGLCDLSVLDQRSKLTLILSPNIKNVEAELLTFNQVTEFDGLKAIIPEEDCTLALWVKWRGKWQTGIQCSKADCPLSTLKAKPTHDRKTYSLVFFPHSRTYSWADMQLVRPITEMPEPLMSGTHHSWLELVKDLTIPRRYIMRKLAASMLDISDKLHTEAVIETARVPTFWKEFAMEASRCKSYSDLGKMLLKLQKMILPGYITCERLKNSLSFWEQQCQNAQSAESVERLTEELTGSVEWSDVEKLWNAPIQPELGSEWKAWKQEAMKWLSTSNPNSSGDLEEQNCDDSISVGRQLSQKRPKLDVCQQEMYTSEPEAARDRIISEGKVETGSQLHSKCLGNSSPIDPLKVSVIETLQAVSLKMADCCDETAGEDVGPKNIQVPGFGSSADGGNSKRETRNMTIGFLNKYKQCMAFMATKGRQCGRWASDGDVYCCVHTSSYSASNTSLTEQAPTKASMCEGTTTHGNKCKHRARNGSVFCKKHQFQRNYDMSDTSGILYSSENKLMGKYEDSIQESISNSYDCSKILSVGEGQTSFEENLVPVIIGQPLREGNCLMNKYEIDNALPAPLLAPNEENLHCIYFDYFKNNDQCLENAIRYTLYCGKHLPNFLKRSRSAKIRFISKEVFMNLLKCCSSRREKIHLHQACELLYHHIKSSLSIEKSSSKTEHMGWVLSEASKDSNVGEYLLKLVLSERSKLSSLWGFDITIDDLKPSSQKKSVPMSAVNEKIPGFQISIKCKICSEEFHDDKTLGVHWLNIHKKEAQLLFRGYSCAICMNSFTNRKVLEEHVIEKHGVQFLQHSILFRCMSCNSHFPNLEKLSEHIISFHSSEFRLPAPQTHDQLAQQSTELSLGGKPYLDNHAKEKDESSQNFFCGICGLEFNLLLDLERHHQTNHMNAPTNFFPNGRTKRLHKTSMYLHPRLRKGIRPAFKIKKPANFGMKKHFQASSSVIAARLRLQNQACETGGLGKLVEFHCLSVAETLFGEVHQTKPQPSNSEILLVAQTACCRTNIHNVLVEKYGTSPENLYLRAAKLCSELNIPINWHLDEFSCPRGCKPLKRLRSLAPLVLLSDERIEPSISSLDPVNKVDREMDGCHYILSTTHLNKHNSIVLCEDISFGKESVPVACVIDDSMKDSLKPNGIRASFGLNEKNSVPWLGFTYVTQRLLEPSLYLHARSSQLGCACKQKCYPETCDHVYLFNNDYVNAKDINGKSMHGRLPYDERGQIELEEGYVVYECNNMCHCDKSCQNRVLQNGLHHKLEIFRTEKKGWAVRAGEAISRGGFVCEYIGEVLTGVEANKRIQRYESEGCRYFYDISALMDHGGNPSETQVPYVIDATNYGNVSRFINHSCSPNLVIYQVLLESMDCQLAHIGLYASRDIAVGEELVLDYKYKLLSGDGCPCHCGSSNCPGRLY